MFYKGNIHFIAGRLGYGGNKFAACIAVCGVACTIAVMLITLAVSSGFNINIRNKLSGFNPDVTVLPPYNFKTGRQHAMLQANADVMSIIRTVYPKNKVYTTIQLPGIIKTENDYAATLFTGYDKHQSFVFQRENIVDGEWPDMTNPDNVDKIVVSRATSNKLGLKVGSHINAVFILNDNMRLRRFYISGIYETNFDEFDEKISYVSIDALSGLLGNKASVTSINIVGVPTDSIALTSESLQQLFIRDAQNNDKEDVPVVDNITHTGAMYLNWLDLLDTNVVVIFILICCVAALTLVSALFIIILNNVPLIGVLRALGASNKFVNRVFLQLTMRLVCVGLIFGNIFALTMIWAQSCYHIIPLDPETYYLDYVPISINLWHIIAINFGILAFSWMILVLPARMTSSFSPALTMRFE